MGVVEEFLKRSPAPAVGAVVKSVTAQIVAMCNCGNPDPMVVPFFSSGESVVVCGTCQVKFSLARLSFDREKQHLSVALAAAQPTIVSPHGQVTP